MINIKSNYSLLSSMLKISDIIKYFIESNSTAAFISDNNMYGVMEFINSAVKENLKPIVGLNIKTDEFNINLYAKSYEGYINLCKLSTIQNEREVIIDDINKYNNDLICVLYFEYKDLYKKFSEIFSDLYLGYSNKIEEKVVSTYTKNIVFFRECLYLNEEDSNYINYLYMIRDGKTVADDNDYIIGDNALYINDINNYTDNKGIITIDEIIAKCNLVFPKKELLLPIYKTPNDTTQDKYLFELAKAGLSKRLNGNIDKKYQERLSYELKIINDMGFCNYFLVVYDFIKYAKKNNILVGPGRGSAAGSLVAYSLGITEIDPLKYDLLFERFLNPERKTMPDIDTDFPDDKREDVINYVREKYGKKRVSGIVTFGTLASRLVLRDVGRVLNIPTYKVDSLTKLIPNISHDKLEDIYKKNINFKTRIDSDSTLKKLYTIALKFEGFPRHISSHAAGIVMCEKDLDEVLPLTISDLMYLTSYSMEYLEDLGLLKMDFLGLKNLSILANIINDIEKEYNKKINFNEIALDDSDTLKIFETADTTGIFQFESSGMKNFLRRLKPNSFEDIFAAIALFRPGPSNNIDTFINRKHGIEKVEYIDKSLEKVLKNTYGIFIYQEQIIQAANIYAGYSLGEADILRRAMSKKKLDLLKQEEEKFIKKSMENNHSEAKSREIFNLILNFAGYGFNRSHSVAYSIIAYRLAYFKVHYKDIFYSNLLNNVISSPSKTYEYILEIKSRSIMLEKPDINISSDKYIVKNNTIYLPFSIIKDVGVVASKNILKAREDGPFKDIYDLFSRLVINGVTKSNIEALIYANSFRSFDYNIQTLINNLDNLINYGMLTKDLDPSLVMKPEIEITSEFNKDILLEQEKELFGFYITNHPTSKYLNKYKNVITLDKVKEYVNKSIYTLVLVEKIKVIKTKKGDEMAFASASDYLSHMEYTLFPTTYLKYNYIERGNILLIKGNVEKRIDQLQIIVDDLKVLNGDNNEK